MIITMVAGEPSGDNLGAPLIRELHRRVPDLQVCGIGGPGMISAGMDSWIDMERLSVNGIVDPLKRLPDIIRILLETRDRVIASGAEVFVGVDFNFFNLLLEGMLHKRGIRTVHYVSPTVWAWRSGRIKRIKRSVDLMMTLYPFETAIYEAHDINAVFVGHPKADEIDPDLHEESRSAARNSLGLSQEQPVLAVLPGSRSSEVSMTGRDFFAAAEICLQAAPELRFVIPAANVARRQQIALLLSEYPQLADHVQVLDGQSQQAMAAADVVLVNGGTATLEAMLLRRPMVMSYRLGGLTYALVSRMMKTPHFALPNILAGRELIPELIQDEARPEALAEAVMALFDGDSRHTMLETFHDIHLSLRRDAAARAAEAVLSQVAT